mgnify:CR=1 FL=1
MKEKDNFWEIEERKDEAGLGNPKRTVCVIGHKNPDTDSICSAIAYAYLKNLDSGDFRYVPVRAGQISAETQYVLNHFQVDAPPFLDNIGTRVRDMRSGRCRVCAAIFPEKRMEPHDYAECIYIADHK